MKNLYLLLFFFPAWISTHAQCPGGAILIDNFDGAACRVYAEIGEAVGTTKSAECSGRAGTISGAGDVFLLTATGSLPFISDANFGYAFDRLVYGPSAGHIAELSVTYDGTDGNTDPGNPTLSGPVLGDFTGREIKLDASIDDLLVGKFVTFTVSAWDALGNRSDAVFTFNGPQPDMSVTLNLGTLSGAANLADIRALQLRITTDASGLDLLVDNLVAECPAILPVRLLGFEGGVSQDQVDLSWKTAEETGFSHFEVRKSLNAKDFETIGTVSGGSLDGQYGFTDRGMEEGDMYYQLNMIDHDGSSALSKMVSVHYEKDGSYLVVENPATGGVISLETNIEEPVFELRSVLGIKVDIQRHKTDHNRFYLNVPGMTMGQYYLTIRGKNNKTVVRRLVIQ